MPISVAWHGDRSLRRQANRTTALPGNRERGLCRWAEATGRTVKSPSQALCSARRHPFAAPGAPAAVPHGSSLHHELELLTAAGLSTVDALRAATVLPARYFGLTDRGSVEPGMRADLVLVDGDPIADITATRRIRGVWCHGVECVIG